MSDDVLKIYERFGNLFKIILVHTGEIFIYDYDHKNAVDEKNRIYFEGKYYSFKRTNEGLKLKDTNLLILKSIITKQFALKIKEAGYRFKGKYKVYTLKNKIKHEATDIFSLFEGFEFRFVLIGSDLFLCIDPRLIFKMNSSIKDLVDKGVVLEILRDFSVFYKKDNENMERSGYLIETINENGKIKCKIKNYDDFYEEKILAKEVFLEPKPEIIQMILNELKINFNVISLQRKLSFLDSKTASRDRFFKTLEIVKKLKQNIFPIKFGVFEVDIEDEPVIIRV